MEFKINGEKVSDKSLEERVEELEEITKQLVEMVSLMALKNIQEEGEMKDFLHFMVDNME